MKLKLTAITHRDIYQIVSLHKQRKIEATASGKDNSENNEMRNSDKNTTNTARAHIQREKKERGQRIGDGMRVQYKIHHPHVS